MPKNRIKLLGGWSAWNDHVQQGRLIRPDGDSTWVLLRNRPDYVVDDEGYQQLRKDAHRLSIIDHPGVLRLLHVTRMAGEPVWVFEGFQGVSMSRVLDTLAVESHFLPIRTAVEIGQRVAQGVWAGLSQGVESGESAIFHPGTSPEEVLVDSIGNIKIAGFSVEPHHGPGPSLAAYMPKERGTADQAASYGLGALLVHLISGECPGKSSDDPARHDAMIRRATIRVLARPGEAVPDKLLDLVRDCLSKDPVSRPSLERISDALESLGTELPAKGLRAWAPTFVPALLQLQDAGYPDPQTAKLQRHVDTDTLDQDESSFEVPPVREDAPREIPTILARPTFPSSDSEAGEQTPISQSGKSLSIPTSETDVKLFQGGPTALPAGGGESQEPVVALDIRASDEPSEEEHPPRTSDGVGGWPLVIGAFAGMIVAAGVGWVVVEQIGGPNPLMQAPVEVAGDEQAAEAPTENAPEVTGEAVAPEAAADEPNEPAPELEIPEEDVPTPEVVEPQAEPRAAPVSEPPAPVPEAEPETEPPPPEPPVVPVGDVFEVVFRSMDPSIDRLEVNCHQGRGQGRQEVRIVDAGRGPCRVIGHRGAEQMAVSAVLTGAKTDFACFVGGQRICE